MELSQLRYFYTAAKYEHITRAAEELHVAQPALTQSIHRLEEELGVRLFERSGRRIVLSQYGKFLKARVEPVFATLDSVPEELRELRDRESRTVRVNVQEASALVAAAIIAYREKNRAAVFKLTQAAEDENCDISITAGGSGGEVLADESSLVFAEKIYLAVPRSSAYAERKDIRLSELREERFACLAQTSQFRRRCDMLCASADFRPVVAFECENPVMMMHLIGSGMCVGFYAEFSWSEVKHTDIRLIPISEPECSRGIVVTNRNDVGSAPEADAFFTFLVEYFYEKQSRRK